MKKLLLILLFMNTIFAEKITKKIENLPLFNKIELYDDIVLDIILIDENLPQYIEIEADDPDLEEKNIKIDSDDITLEIKMSMFKSGKNVYIKLYTPISRIKEISASGSSKIQSAYIFNFIDEVNIEAYSGGIIDLRNVVGNKLNIKASTGGKVRIIGKINSQNVYVSAGSMYYGEKLETKKTFIEFSLGGDAEIWATEELEAEIGSLGTLRYKGNPKNKKIDKIEKTKELD